MRGGRCFPTGSGRLGTKQGTGRTKRGGSMQRLRQLVLMLSSDQDGEVVAAAHAIERTLKADGKDWHWLADLLETRVTPPPPPPPPTRGRTWRDKMDDALDLYDYRLTAWEVQFLHDMQTWS